MQRRELKVNFLLIIGLFINLQKNTAVYICAMVRCVDKKMKEWVNEDSCVPL